MRLDYTHFPDVSYHSMFLTRLVYYCRQSKTKGLCVSVWESRQAMLMMVVELSCLQGLMGLFVRCGGLGTLKYEPAHKRPPNRAKGTMLLHISTLLKQTQSPNAAHSLCTVIPHVHH